MTADHGETGLSNEPSHECDQICHDNIAALIRMDAGEDLSPPSRRHVSKRPSRKERVFPLNAKIDLKVRNHM